MKSNGRGLKVGHVVASLEIGGLERFVADLVRASCDEVVVVCLRRLGPFGAELRASGLTVGDCSGCRTKVGRLAHLVRILWEQAVDVIHCHNLYSLWYARAAGYVLCRPVVFTKHGVVFPAGRLSGLTRPLLRGTWAVGVSPEVCERLRRFLRRRGQVSYIPTGISLAEFAGDGQPHDSRAGFTFGTVARLVPEKDQRTLILAFAQLVRLGGEARLTIVGDGPCRGDLEALACEQGVADRVTFLGERHDARKLLRTMNAFVLSSLTEGMPVSVLEAMAAGVPVIATHVGGLPLIIKNEVTGVLVAPSEPVELCDAMRLVMTDQQFRAGLIEKAAIELSLEWDIRLVARKYHKLYLQAMQA